MSISDVTILLNRVHHPVAVLGPGSRAGVWFQGCGIRCPGCMAIDTWRADPMTAIPVGTVLDWLRGLPPETVDGVTISGGEPTEQPAALTALLTGIIRMKADRPSGLPPIDVLVYTGRSVDWAKSAGRPMFIGADAIVAGPYVADQAGDSPLRGSENQELITLTDLGAQRYAAESLGPRDALQVEVVGGELRLIGIPPPDVLASLERSAAKGGIRLRGSSWR